MKLILHDIDPDDWMLGIRAGKWLEGKPEQKDAIIAYGEGADTKDFFVKRNKRSITVRPRKRA